MTENLDDSNIVIHYLDRAECAISETKIKYGKLINKIAYNILYNTEDADECENDTYLNIWNSIPPNKPMNFKAYCLKISRNLAIKKYQYNYAEKRDKRQQTSLDKIIEECGDIFIDNSVAKDNENELSNFINAFLTKLPKKKRKVFIMRYWYYMSIKEIMEECNMSKSQIEMILFRTRRLLKNELVKEGYYNECEKN